MNRTGEERPAAPRVLMVAGSAALGFAGVVVAWWAVTGGEEEGLRPISNSSQLLSTEQPRPAPASPRHDREKEIELGMSGPFTGPSRGVGIELYRGAMALFGHVNDRGGVHGRKITIRAYDDGYNPVPAIENTVRLVETDDVFLLFSSVGTPTTARCLPLLKQYADRSVLLFFPFTGAQPQRQKPYGEFAFNLRASYYEETAGLVDHLVAVGRARIAVFYQIDAYGRNGWEGVRAALARHQLKMAGEATYRRGTPFSDRFTSQVEILREADPDAVICVGSYGACAGFVRDARDAGWAVPIANISFAASENLLELLHEAGRATGADYTQNLINSQVVPNYADTTLPAVREYRELMDRYRPPPPPPFPNEDYQPVPHGFVSLEGFLNAKLLVAILEKMGPPFDRRRLKPAAEAVRALDLGIGTPVSLSADQHQASTRVYYMVVRGGRFEPLVDWTRWAK